MPFLFVGKSRKNKVLPGAIVDLSFTTALPKGFALTRPEAMLGRSPTTGRWESVPANTPRFDINPITLESNGLLVEPGRTQIVYKTRAPQYAPVLATSTLDATQQTPFGLGALKLTPTAVSGIHGFNFYFGDPRASAIVDGTTLGIQITLKPVGVYTRANLYMLGRDNVYQVVSVLMTGEGAILSNTALSASIARDTDGYYTIKIVRNFGTGTTTPGFMVNFVNEAGTTRTFVGDGTSHFLIAYLGAEIGTEVTTPVINDTTGILTRTPETLTSTVSWIGSAQASSFAIQYMPISVTGTALEVSGAAGDALAMRHGSALSAYYATSQGIHSAIISGAAPVAGVTRTDLITAKTDEFRSCVNGVSQGLDLGGPIPLGLTKVAIGSDSGGSDRMALVVRRIKYWNRSLPLFAAETFSGNIALEGEPPQVPTLSMQSAMTVAPQMNSVTITIVVDGSLTGSQVKYRTLDGTAKSASEYSPISGELFILPNEVAKQVTILLGARPLTEDRSFIFELYDQSNALIENSQCVITLQRVVPQGTPAGSLYDFSKGMPASGWQFTRASTANYRDATGLWVSAASGAPRIHHNAPGMVGLLLEPAACEQRLFNSLNPFLPSSANRVLITVAAGFFVPTGTQMVQFRKDASSAEHKLIGSFTADQCDWPTTDATVWFYARPIGHVYWKLRVKGIDNVWAEARFNFSGEGSTTGVDTAARAYIDQDNFFQEWFRFGLYRAQGASAGVTAEFELIAVNPDGTPALTGIPAEGLDYCHVQVEAAAGMSSPIMVSGATAKTTRAAEVFKADPAATWYKVRPNTTAIQFARLRDQPTTQRILQMKDSSANISPDDIFIRTQPNSLRALVKVQGTQLADILSPTLTFPGISATALLINDTTKVSLYHNGNKAGEDALTVPTSVPQVLRIASSEPFAENPTQMLLQTVALWDHAISHDDAVLFSGNIDFVPTPNQPTVKPVISIPSNLTVTEGSSIVIPLTKVGVGACRVSFRTLQASARNGTDYTGIGPITIEFAANDTSQSITIPTFADAGIDSGKSFSYTITLLDDTCTLGNGSGTCTILEPPALSIPTAVFATEGTTLNITVTKTRAGACSATYRTRQNTALNGPDYTGVGPATVSFTANETSKVIPISILTDAVTAGDSLEKFDFLLENPVDCTIDIGTCTITILQPGETAPEAGTNYTTPVTFANTSAAGVVNDFGIGYEPYYVTSLGTSATTQGTFAHAAAQNNRVIVFEVSGIIKGGQGDIRVSGDNLLIAGETAPSPGIIIQGAQTMFQGAQNVLIRHITFERGYDTRQEAFVLTNPLTRSYNSNGDGIQINSSTGLTTRNVWFDHCATLWTNDEAGTFWKSGGGGTVENISVTNCIFAEPLYQPETLINPSTKANYKGHWENGEPERLHNYGLLIGYGCKRIDLQHNLFMDIYWREPMIDGDTSSVIANNISLNGRLGCHISPANSDNAILNTTVGYLKISGPNTPTAPPTFKFHAGSATTPTMPANSKFWVTNLYAMRGAKSTYPLPTAQVVGRAGTTTLAAVESAALLDTTKAISTRAIDLPTPVVALTADEIYTRAKLNAGPRPKERDQPHMARLIKKLTDKEGFWVNHESEVGGLSGSTGTPLSGTTRSLRNQSTSNPSKFKDGTVIPAFPTATDKAAVRAWLRKFLDELQYD